MLVFTSSNCFWAAQVPAEHGHRRPLWLKWSFPGSFKALTVQNSLFPIIRANFHPLTIFDHQRMPRSPKPLANSPKAEDFIVKVASLASIFSCQHLWNQPAEYFFVRWLKLGWWWKVIEAPATLTGGSSSNIASHIWLNSCQNTPLLSFCNFW